MKKIFKKPTINKYSYFFKLVTGFAMLIGVIIISGAILYRSFYRYSVKELYNNYEHNLSAVASGVEDVFYRSVQASYLIGDNSAVNKILMSSSASLDIYDISEISKYLNKQKMVYGDFIEDIIIADFSKGNIITTSGNYDEEMYFERLAVSEEYDIRSYCKEIVNQTKNFEVLPPAVLKNEVDGTEGRVIPIVFYRNEEVIFINPIIMNINSHYLQNYLDEHALSKNAKMLMWHSDGKKTRYIGSDGTYLTDYFKKHTETSLGTYKGEIIITYKSPQAMFKNFCYSAVIPESDLHEKISPIDRTYFICILLCTLLAVIISLYWGRKMYKPVNKLMGIFSNGGGEGKAAYTSEFDVIEDNIREIVYKNIMLDRKLSVTLPMAGERLLIKLLTYKEAYDKTDILERLHKVGIDFDNEKFIVAVVKFKYHDDFYKKFSEDARKELKESISDLLLSFIQTDYKMYALESNENTILLIFNPDERTNVGNIVQMLQSFTENFKYDKELISVLVGIGSLHSDISGISTSYDEANDAMMNLFLYKDKKVALYNKNISKVVSDITAVEEEKLRAYLEKGNAEDGGRFLDGIIERCMSSNISNGERFVVLLKLYRIIEAAITAKDENVLPTLSQTDLEALSLGEFTENIKSAYCECASYFADKFHKRSIAEVVKYVNEHYHENIYLEMLADEFGFSVKYLSRVFKEYTGVRFVEYLSEIRIKKAKDLLENTEESVNVIGEKVGFGSRNTFYRAFKSAYGITPAEYRKNSR